MRQTIDLNVSFTVDGDDLADLEDAAEAKLEDLTATGDALEWRYYLSIERAAGRWSADVTADLVEVEPAPTTSRTMIEVNRGALELLLTTVTAPEGIAIGRALLEGAGLDEAIAKANAVLGR